jgi:hypothetical protein
MTNTSDSILVNLIPWLSGFLHLTEQRNVYVTCRTLTREKLTDIREKQKFRGIIRKTLNNEYRMFKCAFILMELKHCHERGNRMVSSDNKTSISNEQNRSSVDEE